MVKSFFKKIRDSLPRITTQDSIDTLIGEKVDEALTQFRVNYEFENRVDISSPEKHYRPYLKEAHDVDLKGTKVSEAVLNDLSLAFSANILSVRDQTPEELWAYQDAAYAKYLTNPIATAMVNNISYYTMGSGIVIKVPHEEVQKAINTFMEFNQLHMRCKSMAKLAFIEGEYFANSIEVPKLKQTVIRRIPPKEIVEISTAADDIETVLAYHRRVNFDDGGSYDGWIKDLRYENNRLLARTESIKFQIKDNAHKLMLFKYGAEDQVRGRVPMQPILRYLKYYEDFIIDRLRLNHERSKVVWIRSIKGRSGEASTKNRLSPPGGTMLVENENVTYRIESAKLESGDAEKDGLLILYAIGSAVNIPPHILNQRSDQGVYNSIKKSDTPFAQMIMDTQDFWYINFESLIRAHLDFLVRSKILPAKIKVKSYVLEAQVEAVRALNLLSLDPEFDTQEAQDEVKRILKKGEEEVELDTVNVPLDIVFPDVVMDDVLKQAQVIQIHRNAGIVSRATLSAKAGYNWALERARIEQEADLIPLEKPGKTGDDGRSGPGTRQSSPKTNSPEKPTDSKDRRRPGV